jgi:hypothetical protein
MRAPAKIEKTTGAGKSPVVKSNNLLRRNLNRISRFFVSHLHWSLGPLDFEGVS